MAQIDPVTVEVIGSALSSIVEEMGEALIRASYSTNIKERRDCSTALFDLEGKHLSTVTDNHIDHIYDPRLDDILISTPSRFLGLGSASELPQVCTLLGYWFVEKQ